MRSARRLSAVVLGCVCAFLTSTSALAQSSPPEAIALYTEAREHYAAGRYREAAVVLERALVLDPSSPTLVYNLARVYELLGELDRSLEHYERYQRLLPQQQAREQERAEATIRRLRGARESVGERRVEVPREVEELRQLPGLVMVRENGVADDTFLTALIAGAVFAGTGAVLGGLALAARADADAFVLGRDGHAQVRDDLYSNATLFAGVSDATLALGGTAILIAGLLYFLREHTVLRAPIGAHDPDPDTDDGSARDGVVVEPSADLGPGGASVSLRGAF